MGERLVIWIKTEAGRGEIQARAVVQDRARRTLLLLVDGLKSEEMLLASLAGVTAADFVTLQRLNLIKPVSGGVFLGDSSRAAARHASDTAPAVALPPLDRGQFYAALTKLISTHLGLRGVILILAVEKAGTLEELHDVAQRAIALIRDRKGEAAATEAKTTLHVA